jgi:hypothetical protein
MWVRITKLGRSALAAEMGTLKKLVHRDDDAQSSPTSPPRLDLLPVGDPPRRLPSWIH